MSTIGEVGEFGLIERLVGRLGPGRADTVIGAGHDDAAVLRRPDGRLQLATIDTQVAGVHFRLAPVDTPARARDRARRVGRRTAAINLSDIAAMGGVPTHALATLVAPPDLAAEWALAVIDGLAGELARWGADLVGGNLARGDGVVLDLALLGEVAQEQLLLRSGARPGDVLLVTGDLGGAAAGLALETDDGGADARPAAGHREAVLARLHAPEPRLSVAPLLAPLGATAAIDVSDGLAGDAAHLCARSGAGANVDAGRLPIADSTRAVAAALACDPAAWAIGGGEDYELLFTAPAPCAEALIEEVRRATGIPVTAIGTITEEPGCRLVLPDGAVVPLSGGWRHFG
jgi:thiamine-monophosphate kinase